VYSAVVEDSPASQNMAFFEAENDKSSANCPKVPKREATPRNAPWAHLVVRKIYKRILTKTMLPRLLFTDKGSHTSTFWDRACLPHTPGPRPKSYPP
jgi:hypothetical protein